MDPVTDLSKIFSFGQYDTLGKLLSHLIPVLFTIAGIGVVFYFLIGALRIITSGGNKESIAGARAMITQAIIGFVLLMLVFLLSIFIPQVLGLKNFFNPFGP